MEQRTLNESLISSAAQADGRSALQGALFDLLAVALLTPLLIIPALAIAAAVFVDSSGSVIYRARRIGRDGREFSMLKFRTMRDGAVGPGLTRRNDDRITPLGQFLRKTRLDELPQLINVARGDMRLVGPRPEAGEFVARYREEYEEILAVRPGITGATQLEFAAQEAHLDPGEDDALSNYYATNLLPEKVARDVHYVRTRTPAGDVKIVLRTIAMPFRFGVSRFCEMAAARGHLWLAAGSAAVVVMAVLATAGSPR